jgi:hypothetical protein
VAEPAHRVVDNVGRAPVRRTGGAHAHEVDHRGAGQRITQPRLVFRWGGQQPCRGGSVDRAQRIIELRQMHCGI